jgi:DNA-binding beta-propeller fold protein YncE
MTGRLLAASAVLIAGSFTLPGIGSAQTFKVEKFDIKGDGGTDYVAVEAATGRVFVSRANHMMVVEGATGKVLGDIPNTPGVHGAGIATKSGHGFTTNGGDMTVTMFDLKTLAVIKQIMVGPGLDGIMYDEPDDKIILTNHSRPIGTLTAIDPKSGDIVATVELEDTAPEGAAADGKGHIFDNNEGKSTIQVIDRDRPASRMTKRRIAFSQVVTGRPWWSMQAPERSWQTSPTARASTLWDGTLRRN